MRLRPATDDDGPALRAVIAGVFAEYPGCIFLDAEFPELARPATSYCDRGGCLWVADNGDAIVGSLAVEPTTRAGWFALAKVYLAKFARGRGLATGLLARAIDLAAGRGGHTLELFTDTRFRDGHRFYERNGFVRVPGERWLGTADHAWEYHYVRGLDPSRASNTRQVSVP